MSVTFNNMVYGSFTYRTPVAPGVYNITSGTKAPVFGTGPGAYPPASWTGIQNASADDAYTIVPNFPFTFYHSGKASANVYVGSNSYLTYGGGSNVFNTLSSSNPPLPKFFLGSADNSYQRVSYYIGTDYVRLRYEGTGATSGTIGNPNIVYEVTHFNPALFGGNNVIEVLVGKHVRTFGALFGSANNTTYYVSGTIAANQSYVFDGTSTGNNHTLYTGYYISGTDY